jgi:hypothetical protein
MSENNVIAASIKSFGHLDHVEPVIAISASQFQDIITHAVKEAVEPLQDHIKQLKAEISDLEKQQDHLAENELIQLRLINQCREEIFRDDPTATEQERVKRIEDLCANAPGHMISLAELRGRLGIHKVVLSRLLKMIDGDRFYLKKSATDKRERYLCMKPVIGKK